MQGLHTDVICMREVHSDDSDTRHAAE